MNTLTPPQRAALTKRLREVNSLIQEPRMSMKQINDLQKERTALSQRLNEGLRHRYAVNVGAGLSGHQRLISPGRDSGKDLSSSLSGRALTYG